MVWCSVEEKHRDNFTFTLPNLTYFRISNCVYCITVVSARRSFICVLRNGNMPFNK